MPIVTRKYHISNKTGLHARPAAKFVKLAASFIQQNIWIENITRNSCKVNAKSFIMVLSLSIEQNDEIQITIDGQDGESILDAFNSFFETDTGEVE